MDDIKYYSSGVGEIYAPAEYYRVSRMSIPDSWGSLETIYVKEIPGESGVHLRNRLEEAAIKYQEILIGKGCNDARFYRFSQKGETTRGIVFGFDQQESQTRPFATNETGFVSRWAQYVRKPTNDNGGQVVLQTKVITTIQTDPDESPKEIAQRFVQAARAQIENRQECNSGFYGDYIGFHGFNDWVLSGFITYHSEEAVTFQAILNPQ